MNANRPIKIGPRGGEFGKSWTRAIGARHYWFKVESNQAGRRVTVIRLARRGEPPVQRTVHTLYDCDPAEFEAWISAQFARRVIGRNA